MSTGNGIFNFFRNLFTHQQNNTDPESSRKSGLVNDFRNPIWDTDESDESDNDFRRPNSFTFNIYSDPLEMHRFFEQKMNDMMKNFQMFESFTDSMDQFMQFDSSRPLPFDEFSPHPPATEKNIRDELLKPGFTAPSKNKAKTDTVLDGSVNSSNIGTILDMDVKDESASSSLIPGSSSGPLIPGGLSGPLVPAGPPGSLIPGFSFSGKSYVSRTVRLPDGTTEREEIVKDSDGNEKKTVTRKTQDGGEYTVTTFKDANGQDMDGLKENFLIKDPFKDFGGWEDPFFKNFGAWNGEKSKWWSW